MQISHSEEITNDLDFSDSSRSVWYILNRKYKGSGSHEYERSWDATADVKSSIEYIRKNATKADATSPTKQSALETLRKIGKSVTLAPSTLGSEVQKQLGSDDCLERAMIEIVLSLNMAERKMVALSEDEKGRFVDKVEALWGESDGLCIFERLPEVLALLAAAVETKSGVVESMENADSEEEDFEEHNSENENVDHEDGSEKENPEVDEVAFSSEDGTDEGDEDQSSESEIVDDKVVVPITNPRPASQCETDDDAWSESDWYAEEE